MPVKLLVITPQPAFGELIRQSLEQTGSYRVVVSQSANAALMLSQKASFELAILDSDMGTKPMVNIGRALRSLQPGIKILAIPPNHNGDHKLIDDLRPEGYINKPFYLPDLIDTLEKVFAETLLPKTPDASPPPGPDGPEEAHLDDDIFWGSEMIPSPNPVEQLNIAESWFKEAEGKTIPLMGLSRSISTAQPGDTAPIVIRIPRSATHLEPRPSALSKPIYTSALVPRMPQHYLAGDLASSLGQWIPQLCQAFGWNLEGLSIRPDYLQWIVRIPPALSPGKMLRVIRERTSQRIFTDFQQLSKDNPSGSFWAPGFLMVSGARSLPLPVLHKYVTEIRQRP